MNRFRRGRFTFFLLGWTAMGAASAHAAVYTVNSNGDTGAGGGNSGDLRYCLTQANANPDADIINFNAGLGTITLGSRLPVITTAMTINGAGNTISGNNQFRVFFVSPPNATDPVSISNLTIANGRAIGGTGGGGGGGGAGLGGGVFVDRGTVRLQGIVFNNCSAVGGNGGSGATLQNGFGGGGRRGRLAWARRSAQ